MRYLDSVKLFPLTLIALGCAFYFLPNWSTEAPVDTILTISTFLYAIFLGFFLDRAKSRFNRVRELVSSEDATWLSLSEVAGFFGPTFQKKINTLIDKYYIVAYDYYLEGYYRPSAPVLSKVYDAFDALDLTVHDSGAADMFDDAVVLLNNIEERRNESNVVTSEQLNAAQWLLVVLLATVIILSLVFVRTPDLFSFIAITLLATALVTPLFILRDLQSFNFGGNQLMEESGQEVLESIGKKRYYNYYQVKRGVNRPPINVTYRLGVHKPGEKQKIVTIKAGEPFPRTIA